MKKILILLLTFMAIHANAQKLERGYAGSVEMGGLTDFDGTFFNLSTTHGFQFDERWFVGGGASLLLNNVQFANFYAAGRCYSTRTKSERWTPYGEVRFGVEFGDIKTQCFFEPSAGVRYTLNNKLALSARLGWYFDGGSGLSFTAGVHF